MIAYVIPTHDRPEQLAETLHTLGALPAHLAQVIVVDNDSRPAARPVRRLANGMDVSVVRRPRNEGAAGRNAGVRASDRACEWLVMLDDDSHPMDLGFLRALAEAPADVAAVAAQIALPEQGGREAGGLPEVFIGCGVAIRRRAFLESGGYDAAFDYYAEEYDLSARLLLAGWRVTLDRRLRVAHHKVDEGRDMGRILRRLVRNNGWVAQRYAPEAVRRAELAAVVRRYGAIARRERAVAGYARGLAELGTTLWRQKRTPMGRAMFDRFTGLAAAREALGASHRTRPFRTAAIVEGGKNERLVRRALQELGVRIVDDCSAAGRGLEGRAPAEALVIGTLSPGPLLDAYERVTSAEPGARVIAPWPGLAGTSQARAGVPLVGAVAAA